MVRFLFGLRCASVFPPVSGAAAKGLRGRDCPMIDFGLLCAHKKSIKYIQFNVLFFLKQNSLNLDELSGFL